MQIFIQHEPLIAPVPVVASVPHSGRFVPDEIAATFEPTHRYWLRNTDWFLPRLYSFLPELGVTMLEATHSRYVADVNRSPAGRLFGPFFESVIAESSAFGDPVYATPPSPAALAARLPVYHAPFHRALADLVRTLRTRFARILLLDLHSFGGPMSTDVCLGDGNRTTCSLGTMDAVAQAFGDGGFGIDRDTVFQGGYTVREYCRMDGVEAIQVELHYANYLDATHIDEPVLPVEDPVRIAVAQERLRPVLQRIVEGFGRT
jgi:N-formylglutamate deformylase